VNYPETIDYLFQKLPIYQRTGKIAYKSNKKEKNFRRGDLGSER